MTLNSYPSCCCLSLSFRQQVPLFLLLLTLFSLSFINANHFVATPFDFFFTFYISFLLNFTEFFVAVQSRISLSTFSQFFMFLCLWERKNPSLDIFHGIFGLFFFYSSSYILYFYERENIMNTMRCHSCIRSVPPSPLFIKHVLCYYFSVFSAFPSFHF